MIFCDKGLLFISAFNYIMVSVSEIKQNYLYLNFDWTLYIGRLL